MRMLSTENSYSWSSSSSDLNYLASVEEYSERKIHKGEPEPGNGNVNTVYFVNQARVGRTEFVYAINEARLQICTQLYFSFLLRMFVKNILLKISFCA